MVERKQAASDSVLFCYYVRSRSMLRAHFVFVRFGLSSSVGSIVLCLSACRFHFNWISAANLRRHFILHRRLIGMALSDPNPKNDNSLFPLTEFRAAQSVRLQHSMHSRPIALSGYSSPIDTSASAANSTNTDEFDLIT